MSAFEVVVAAVLWLLMAVVGGTVGWAVAMARELAAERSTGEALTQAMKRDKLLEYAVNRVGWAIAGREP